jgi:hypothetical protein
MSFVQFCDDELWEVCSQKMRKIEVFSKFGEPLGTVEVSEQLIMPDAIVFGDRCFIRRAEDLYYEVFAVVATAINESRVT